MDLFIVHYIKIQDMKMKEKGCKKIKQELTYPNNILFPGDFIFSVFWGVVYSHSYFLSELELFNLC